MVLTKQVIKSNGIITINFNDMEKMTARDIRFLKWIHGRMICIHEENENYDYMIRFKKIIEEQEQLSIANVSQQRELLPTFLFKEDDEIKTGVPLNYDITDEWNDYLKNAGNCG